MDRTERFYKINLLLQNRGSVSFEALREELSVSVATLKRDLQYLRDRMNVPIVYDRFDNGYRLDAAGNLSGAQGKQAQHALPGMWFSERELHALLTMHQLMSSLDDDGVLARHMQPMLGRVQGMLGVDAGEVREMQRRVKLIGTARRRTPSQHFELIGSALMQRQRLWIRYFKRSGRVSSEREVSPQRLVNYRNTWYLDAWCHASEALRRFALDAVQAARVLEARARAVSLKEIEASFDAGYGIYGGAQVKWATLLFDADAAQWVSNEEWHPQQKSRWLSADGQPLPKGDRSGSYELQVPYSDPTELMMDILRHGDSVRVTGDKALASAVAKRLQKAAAQYA
jgi:predicted DNA-binding transcriptional regulator YafY